MKKIVCIVSVLSLLFIMSGCGNDKKSEATSSSTKVESSSKTEAEKVEAKMKKADKKKQEEISKKVLEADAAMKAAEANPTDDTIAAAKSAVDDITGGNSDLQKRLETVQAKLETNKQQSTASNTAYETNITIPAATLSAYRTAISQAGLDSGSFSDEQLNNYYNEAHGGGDPGTLISFIARDRGLDYQSLLSTLNQAQGNNPDGTEPSSEEPATAENNVVNSEDQAMKMAQSTYGDNNGAWTWGSMGEVEDGYFVKAYDLNDGTMTHTVKSVIVHYDGTVTEN